MKLSLPELKSAVASYVDASKIAVDSYSITRDNIVGLVDKIAKIFTLDTEYVDKLAIFDGESFSFAKDIEELQQDLILPSDYNASGDDALAPAYPTYRPPFYSKSLGKKVFKTSIPNNNIERAVHFIEQFNSIVSMESKRLFDSEAIWRYEPERQILAVMIGEVAEVYATTKTFTANTKYDVGEYLRSASTGAGAKVFGIVVKPIAVATALANWAAAVSGGYVVVADLATELALPTDTSSAEAFIKQLKVDVEIASDVSEGHSLSGNTLGASGSLVLLVKQGVMPSLEVDAMAGAFHLDKLGIPAEVKVIKDFGSDATGVFAMLIDSRSVRLHNSYRAVRENMNGSGDFLNLFLHTENTAHFSRNTFVKIYRAVSE